MINKQPNIFIRCINWIWNLLNFSRRLIINLLFIGVIILIFSLSMSDQQEVSIAEKNVLILNFNGPLVEQKTYRDPAEELLNQQLNGESSQPEVLISDAIYAIEKATDDPRIVTLVLDLQNFNGGGLDKLKVVGKALEQFKSSGKKIYAFGEFYTQDQYFLASYADEINLDPMGAVMIDGYSLYNIYFKEALSHLKVTQHVFKVGKYKSAVEPFTRNDMSTAAKEANQAWLDELWLDYKTEISQRRTMNLANFDESFSEYLAKLQQVDGDFAQYALTNGWIDHLKTQEQIRQQLIELVGENQEETFNHIVYHQYLKLQRPVFELEDQTNDKVAIVVARGVIMDGEQQAGDIGGDSTARLLRQARKDDSVKAVVLRVDSPGGSAFASEVIRREIDWLQKANKPVIASMGSVAASGGYWISSSADQIWAAPTTITGSIGIYGLFMTFENSLSALGINTDGINSSELASLSVTRPLDPLAGEIIQLNVERGYQRFIQLVAEHRNMTLDEVKAAAEGRVWTGSKALELGLIDQLGDLNDAVEAAAKLAELTIYEEKLIEPEISATDKFYQDLLDSTQQSISGHNQASTMRQLLAHIEQKLAIFQRFNDPQHTYVHCTECPML